MKRTIFIVLLIFSTSLCVVNAETFCRYQDKTEQTEAKYREAFRQFLESFCRKYYNLCYRDLFVEGSIKITEFDMYESNVVHIVGTHAYKYGKNINPKSIFEAYIEQDQSNPREMKITFKRWIGFGYAKDQPHWEKCERKYTINE